MISAYPTPTVSEGRRFRAVQYMRIAANLALATPVVSQALILWLHLVEKSHDAHALNPMALAAAFVVVSIVAFYVFAIEANRRSQGGRRIPLRVVVTLFMYPLLFCVAALPVARICFQRLGGSSVFDLQTVMLLCVGMGLTLMSLMLPTVYGMTLLSLFESPRSSK